MQHQGIRRVELLGKYFGYPQCCIDWFVDYRMIEYSRLTPAQDEIHGNQGFIPCPTCAEDLKRLEKPITDLIKVRICPVLYPNQTPEYETQAWLDEQLKEEV